MEIKKNVEIDSNSNFTNSENNLTLNLKVEEANKLLSFLQISLNSNTCGVITISDRGDIISVNDEFKKIWRIPDLPLLNNNFAGCKTYLESQLEDRSQLSKIFKKKMIVKTID